MIVVFIQGLTITGHSLPHDVQFEHAFSFVTKAYEVILSVRQKIEGYRAIIFYLYYRNLATHTIMATGCDRIYCTELQMTTRAPSPTAKF